MDFLNVLKTAMNFSIEFVLIPQQIYGSEIKTGRYDGLLGELQDGNVDFSINLAQLTKERQFVLEFPRVLASYKRIFIWRQQESSTTYNFLYLFTNDLNFYILITLVIITAYVPFAGNLLSLRLT